MKRVNNADINFVINPNYVNLANFTIKFYTTNEKYFYIEKNQDDVTTRERQAGVGGVDYIVKLDWSQLITIGKGVLNYKITNNYEDDDRADAEYNTSFERTSVYYIDSNVTVSEEEAESYAQVVAELGDRIDAEIVRSESADTEQSLALNTEIETRQNQVDIILNLIQDISGETDLSNYYTKDETYNKTATDELLSAKLDTTAYTPTDLSNYYTKSETSGATEISDALSAKLDTTAYTPTDLSDYYTKSETSGATEISTALGGKQNTLVSATNIKTINNESILGSGNIDIQGGGKAIEAGRGITVTTGETADTVSFNLPISAGTGTNSIIFGDSKNEAKGVCAFAGGSTSSILKNEATKEASFAFGKNCKASGNYSHAEGLIAKASGDNSHAEGYYTTASGNDSHAEGNYTVANGSSSHAEGSGSKANGDYSHAEGAQTSAMTDFSHAEGQGTIANNQSEHASGQYNVSSSASTTFGDSGNTLFSVGNGTANNARHNAFEIRQNGDIYLTKDGQDVKLQDQLGVGGSSTFDENYPVLEGETYQGGVQWQPLTSFTENSVYVKPYEGYEEDVCRITITVDEIGDGYVNLYLTGSTVYSLYDGESAVLDYVNIQRGGNGYFKITQIDFSKNVILTSNSNSKFYFAPYIIESGSTEDAIKQAAQKTLDASIEYSNNHLVAGVANFGYTEEDLTLTIEKGGGSYNYSITNFLTKDGEIYNNNGLKVKPIVNSGSTTWSTIFEVPDGKYYGDYTFPYFIDGSYKKFRVYYYSGITFTDGEEMYIIYNISNHQYSVQFNYNESQGTFVTENQDFTCTKQNYYLEFEYIGSDSSFRWEIVTFYNHLFQKSDLERIDVYGKQLLNLQEAYESVNDKLGGLSLVVLTESEYEQITKDENTVYIIK